PNGAPPLACGAGASGRNGAIQPGWAGACWPNAGVAPAALALSASISALVRRLRFWCSGSACVACAGVAPKPWSCVDVGVDTLGDGSDADWPPASCAGKGRAVGAANAGVRGRSSRPTRASVTLPVSALVRAFQVASSGYDTALNTTVPLTSSWKVARVSI